MKLFLISIFFLLGFTSIAQTESIFLKTKEKDNKLHFIVYNNTENAVDVELVLQDVKGLRGNKRAVEETIPPFGSATVKKLRIKDKYSFNYGLNKSYSKKTLVSKEKNVDNVNLEEGIIVFNKEGCPRCEFLVSYLMENNIDFQLMDLDNEANKKLMYKLLEESGVYEKRVMTPIVVVDQKITHSHEDLQTFAKNLE